MTQDQYLIVGVLAGTLFLFVQGRLRYDIVALLALGASGLLGLVPGDELFSGFGHPAVITVAAVLVISQALVNSGLIDVVVGLLGRVRGGPRAQLIVLTSLVAVCSAFMNNVGALAVFIPIAIQVARKHAIPVSQLLMPLAFASLLGGVMTGIGTPPNIIISQFRVDTGEPPFRMFDFLPVGGAVALSGLAVMWMFSARLLPNRPGQGTREELFDIASYLTELSVPEESKWIGKSLRELNKGLEVDLSIVGLVRGKRRLPAPSWREQLNAGDILIVESDAERLKSILDATGFKLEAEAKLSEQFLVSDEIVVMEAVVGAGSALVGHSAERLNLRRRQGINVLAIAREGKRLEARVQKVDFSAGDVLLLQGDAESLPETLDRLGCLPLAERPLRINFRPRALLGLGIFAAAIGFAAVGLVSIALAFTLAVVLMQFAGLISLRRLYEDIDWPIIVLLGAILPVGVALETTGAASRLADFLLHISSGQSPVVALVALMVVTLLLSDWVNNAAAAVLMAPVGVALARGMGVDSDPFLMGVAISASSAFLTPIGHQSNTLVMGPGGYRFGDYWKLGLPVSVAGLVFGVIAILIFWPL